MAYTNKLRSTRAYIAIGDGATPTEVFSPLCGITTKGLTQTRATSETVDWDCADPDATPITVRDTGATDWSITGSGLLHRPLLGDIQDAFESATPTNFRFVFDEPTTDQVIDGFFAGPGIVTELTITGENGQYLNISITITAAGPIVFTPNP